MTARERLKKLIQRLTETRDKLMAAISEEGAGGNVLASLQARVRKIERELEKARKQLDAELRRIALQSYFDAAVAGALAAGMSRVIADSIKAGGARAAQEVLQTPETATVRTIEQIMFDKREQAREAMDAVGRRVDDVVREITMEVVAKQLSDDPITPARARKMLAEQLVAQDGDGRIGIRYKDGKIVPYDKYAAMVARTTEREAANTAFIQTAIAGGTGLVRMTTHSPTCKLCAPRQGRVYRVMDFPAGDERNGFPHISMAFPGWPQYMTVHPNCKHTLRPLGFWHELPEAERRAMLAEAQKPFDLDPRSESDIAAYNAMQEKNRRKNEDHKQYERYKAVLGGDMPKTFSGWQRMKQANSERYSFAKLDYHRRKALTDDPSLALPNVDRATAAEAKFTRYLFNPNSEDGWSKGVAIERRLGYNIDNWEELQSEVLARAAINPAKHSGSNAYGEKYEQQIVIYGPNGRPTNVLVGWFVDESGTRMTTLHLKEVKNR